MDNPNHEESDNRLFPVLSPRNLSMPSPAARRNTEDVWSDINLSILEHPNHNKAFSMPNTILLDFVPGSSDFSTITYTPPTVTPSMPSSTTVDCRTAAKAFPRPAYNKAAEEAEGHRRHKRQIKNRESADRSRARKKAYIIELEMEVSRLHQDNARIRRQTAKQLEAIVAAERHQIQKKKHGLYRTLTGPF